MKKKILLIAVLFMVTLLTGCGSKEKVVIYTSMEEERNQKLSEMVKNKSTGLNVNTQSEIKESLNKGCEEAFFGGYDKKNKVKVLRFKPNK